MRIVYEVSESDLFADGQPQIQMGDLKEGDLFRLVDLGNRVGNPPGCFEDGSIVYRAESDAEPIPLTEIQKGMVSDTFQNYSVLTVPVYMRTPDGAEYTILPM